MKVLLIDHDDSFTQNLKHWLQPLSTQIRVVNHQILKDAGNFQNIELNYDLFVLSPGPKRPADYPHTLKFLRTVKPATAIYGVCLGLQMMAISDQATVSIYSPPKHGKVSKLKTNETPFQNLKVARYHSIKANKDIENNFKILAASEDDDHPMWIQHLSKKWMAVQFHPESFLTEKPELHLQALQKWVKA